MRDPYASRRFWIRNIKERAEKQKKEAASRRDRKDYSATLDISPDGILRFSNWLCYGDRENRERNK